VFVDWAAAFDAVLTLAVLGEAPLVATTGDPRCCMRWTLVGAPTIAIPTGLGPNFLPLAVQFVGNIDRDRELIRAARWFEAVRPPLPRPAPLEHPR